MKYAAKLTGHTLNEILGEESGYIGGKRTKGYFGQMIESGYFFIDNNSLPLPDFQKVGMELKVSPMKETKDGLVSKERLVLGIINYNDVPVKHFRIFTDKNSHILIVFYLWYPEMDVYDYMVLKVVDWRPSAEDLRMIKEDWDIIESYVIRGEAHLLSERHTKYLAACTKGVGHGEDLRQQPNSTEMAKQRALSFKASFVTSIFKNYLDLNEYYIDNSSIIEDVESLFKDDWVEEWTFEEYVLRHFDKFKGKRCSEIETILDISLDDSSKGYYHTLILAMMGIRGKRYVKEFVQANISIKTIRIKRNGTPKESMSFPAFRYETLVQQEWEESDFYEQLDREFFFPVFQFDLNNVDDVPRKDLRFVGAFFWSLPDSDFAIVGDVWEDTKQKIMEERFDDFVKASEQRIAHIRPHGRNKLDTYPYKGKEYTKRCFWLNSGYIEDVVKKGLKRKRLDDFF